ncbi:unnamed protein product, partial [Urochloa humidicola]
LPSLQSLPHRHFRSWRLVLAAAASILPMVAPPVGRALLLEPRALLLGPFSTSGRVPFSGGAGSWPAAAILHRIPALAPCPGRSMVKGRMMVPTPAPRSPEPGV